MQPEEPPEAGSDSIEPEPSSKADDDPENATESEAGRGVDESVDPTSISNIERIVLDPDELLRTLAYNGQEDIGRKGKAVYSLTPPFDETVEPTLRHLADDSTEDKAADEIHLRPFRFVVEGRRVIDQRPTRGLATDELESPDDATIEAWIDEAMVAWKDHVRENLAESVDIFSPHGMAIIDVEYADDEHE